MIWISC